MRTRLLLPIALLIFLVLQAEGEVTVLFDQSRLLSFEWYRYDWHYFSLRETHEEGCSRLRVRLLQQGYNVEAIRYKPIRPAQLENAQVLVIPEVLDGYSDAEIAAIVEFVENGGSLFLSVVQLKPTGTPPRQSAYRLATALGGALAAGGVVCDPDDYRSRQAVIRITDFTPHPITAGVEAYYHVGTYVSQLPEGAVVLARSDENSWFDEIVPRYQWFGNYVQDPDELTGPFPVLVAFQYGAGRVVMAGDAGMFLNAWINTEDAGTLALNIFAWLAEPFMTQEEGG
ncbi:MAG TPA: DUF4350 domain-containing protein [Candidatus Acetothermia bacterium]|nr:DUF4350 domain-containing protein [Candidatus Acetothermia bacterium]